MSLAIRKASKHVESTTGLTWFDLLYFRYLKGFSGENSMSIEAIDMLTFMKGLEYLDICAYIEKTHNDEMSSNNK